MWGTTYRGGIIGWPFHSGQCGAPHPACMDMKFSGGVLGQHDCSWKGHDPHMLLQHLKHCIGKGGQEHTVRMQYRCTADPMPQPTAKCTDVGHTQLLHRASCAELMARGCFAAPPCHACKPQAMPGAPAHMGPRAAGNRTGSAQPQPCTIHASTPCAAQNPGCAAALGWLAQGGAPGCMM